MKKINNFCIASAALVLLSIFLIIYYQPSARLNRKLPLVYETTFPQYTVELLESMEDGHFPGNHDYESVLLDFISRELNDGNIMLEKGFMNIVLKKDTVEYKDDVNGDIIAVFETNSTNVIVSIYITDVYEQDWSALYQVYKYEVSNIGKVGE